jgi:hypothetical protein
MHGGQRNGQWIAYSSSNTIANGNIPTTTDNHTWDWLIEPERELTTDRILDWIDAH